MSFSTRRRTGPLHSLVAWRTTTRRLARKFTADIFAAETACRSRADGFDEALHDVLKTWDRIDQKAFVLEAMLSIHHHNEVLDLLRAVRAIGIRCYIASNQ